MNQGWGSSSHMLICVPLPVSLALITFSCACWFAARCLVARGLPLVSLSHLASPLLQLGCCPTSQRVAAWEEKDGYLSLNCRWQRCENWRHHFNDCTAQCLLWGLDFHTSISHIISASFAPPSFPPSIQVGQEAFWESWNNCQVSLEANRLPLLLLP